MKQALLKTLQANATPLPASATKKQLLESVANMISAIGPAKFKTLWNVEGSLSTLRETAVAGTAMEPIAEALKAGGRDPGTNVGGVMDAMNLTQADVNLLACHCHNGDDLSADQAAANLRSLASRA